MPCLRKSHSPDNAIGERADWPPIPTRRVIPRRLPGAVEFWHNWRQGLVNSLPPLSFFHVGPRWLSSLFVTESEITMEAFAKCAKNIGRT